MIKKGYHFIVHCDSKGCQLSYAVGTAKHGFDARRQAKQKVIKEGWTPGPVGTFVCPECKSKTEKENAKLLADAIKETEGETKTPVEVEAADES